MPRLFIEISGSGSLTKATITDRFTDYELTIDPSLKPWINRILGRIRLTEDLQIYVLSATGNDSAADGSQSFPFATLQAAHDYVQRKYDLDYQFTVTYQASGTFGEGVKESGPLVGQAGPGNEIYNFTESAVTAGSSNYAFLALYGAMFTVQQTGGLTIEAPGPLGVGGAASAGGVISFGPLVTFSNCGLNSVQTSWGGTIYLNGFYTTGSSQAFAFASGGVIQFNPGYTNYVLGASYGVAFIWAYGGGVVGATGQTFQGTCTGQSVRAELGGVVSCGGSGSSFPPGRQPIEVFSGGQYQ